MSDDLAGDGGPAYRVPRHSGMDPATRRLALLAAGLGGALFVMVGAWSMLGGHSGPVPVISPPSGPLRVKPENPGGMKVTDNVALLGGGDATDAQGDKLAPAPEAPDPQALVQPQTAGPPASPPAAVPPAVAMPPPPPAERASEAPAEGALAGSPPPAPIAKPVGAEPRPQKMASKMGSGPVQVQLAALPSKEQAEAEWRLLTRRAGHLLDGRAPSISEAVVNGHTWWRVRTGGFADPAEARAFCSQLRATGGACSVARF